MPETDDAVLCLDDMLLAEAQVRLNEIFANDLQFPVYLIRSPEEHSDCLMSVSGGSSSLYYRDIISDWRGSGYPIKIYRDEMAAPVFYGTLAHEIAHCFTPMISTPWSCLPEEMGFLPVPKADLKPIFGTPQDDFDFHRPEFWRLAFHAGARAAKAGLPCTHRHIGMLPADADMVYKTIVPEIEELEKTPLWKIAMRPLPRLFARLFCLHV